MTSQNQTQSNRSVASIKPSGFNNFGNTCYLNATLKLTIHALTSQDIERIAQHKLHLTCDEFGHIYKHDDRTTTKILPKPDENNPNQTLKRAVLDIPGATIRMMHYRKCK